MIQSPYRLFFEELQHHKRKMNVKANNSKPSLKIIIANNECIKRVIEKNINSDYTNIEKTSWIQGESLISLKHYIGIHLV